MDIQPQGASACHYRLKLLLIYLLLVAVEIVLIRRAGHGIFSYSLDDPYIHLALAQRILHGHYGLNAGEAASPSSSVLWPFLLAPISTVSFRAWSPLLLNVAAGCGACVLLDKLLRRWNVLCFQPRSIAQVVQWLFAFLLVLAGNLVGLAIVGMEHTLQVLLMIGCVYGLLEVYADRPIPRWVLVMAAVAPAVRYEDLAFTLAVSVACILQGRRREGLLTFGAGLLPLILFGLCLHARGLPVLPISVLVKGAGAARDSDGTGMGHHSALHNAVLSAKAALHSYATESGRWNILFGTFAIAITAAVRRHEPAARNALLCALFAIVPLMLFGPYGWLMRYDVALRLFIFLILLILLITAVQRTGFRVAAVLLLGAVFANSYRAGLKQSVRNAQTIAREQYWMHVFEEQFYRGPVAVNDLGWVSFDHDPAVYVLDLGGLASAEVARAPHKDAAFLREVTQRHAVRLAMIYRAWFPRSALAVGLPGPDIPTTWTRGLHGQSSCQLLCDGTRRQHRCYARKWRHSAGSCQRMFWWTSLLPL